MNATEQIAVFGRRGIQLRAEGERLSYDAPAGQLQASDLEKLRSHKTELLAYLNREAANRIADPAGPCPDCGSGQWWQLPGQAWHCRACEPDMPLAAAILTLPCHEVELRPVAAHAELRTLFENACRGLGITPEQLRNELQQGGDLADLVLGELRPAALAELILQRWTTKEAEIAEAAQLLGRIVHATFILPYH